MKAVVAVLFAALAVAHAGLIAAPVATQYTATTLGGLPLAVAGNGVALAAPAVAYAAPAVAYAAPAAIAAPVVAAPIGAGYTAVTRGAVHTAPLPGHAIGSAHVNVQPAPGTL
ncbi:hypothetical protein R5R35_009309 [Gryllus longicercus]|uniref:Accessory gland protein n=1 Tax=Gryllus longicercus TaxID=2509291 RepID=A0AAN9VXV6_9ORTH